jgi:nucleoside-diphosphate-sugar epimerase
LRILVSGGTGLVGRYIVEGLLTAGHDVVVGARTRPPDGYVPRPVNFVQLHLDPDLDQAPSFTNIDGFVHAAFDHLPGRYRGGEGDDPVRFRRLNENGTKALFTTAKHAGVERAVFLSSRAVYDGMASGTVLTEDLDLSPTSLYGQVKLACETSLASLAAPGFTTTSLRATGIYGSLRPNKWDSLIADAIAGKTVAPRAGTEVHGDDVAQAVRLLLEADPATVSGQSFNLSDIVLDTRMILESLGVGTELPPSSPLDANVMDTNKIRRIGWSPGGMRRFQVTMGDLARHINAGS